jgi:hypothetical protein
MGFGGGDGSDSQHEGGTPAAGTDNLLLGEVGLPFGASERKIVGGGGKLTCVEGGEVWTKGAPTA